VPAHEPELALPASPAPDPVEGAEPSLLAVGALAPDFRLLDQHGESRTLVEHRGRAVVLYFYPRDATPGCTTEACAFRDAWERLQTAGAIVYGASTDDVDSHRAFAEEHSLPFSLLADTAREAMTAYGVPTINETMAKRVTFLVGPDGRITHVFPEVDPAVHVDEVLHALGSVESPSALRRRIESAVAAADRPEADRALDAGRRPAAWLTFFGIGEGARVAELFAGTGTTTELLARVVGPSGRVYAQNNRFLLERFAERPWSARLRKRVMAPVVRVDRELDDPLPEEARDLDAVLFVLAYHDTVWMETDRAAMNRAVFEALRSGGVYGIVDHEAAPRRGIDDVQTLHRIESATVIAEVEAAGFRLDERARFLEKPDDAHDWNASPSAAGERRGQSDRFVLRFVKP
jgi:peroxiredoxin/predicted methyltransferase